MKYPKAELCDRLSIATLKKERIGEQECIDEYNVLKYELKNDIKLIPYIKKLYEINKCIWDLEAAIRQGKIGTLGLEEVGKRAILIRNFNNQRVKTKNEITKLTKDGFIDIKRNHCSED